MAENKTKQTDDSVQAYLEAIEDEARRADCQAVAKLMTKVTKQKPKMWGASIVGFGSYHYVYDSGRQGDMCLTGFSSRKESISIYLSIAGEDQETLLKQLGKHKLGKGCLYVKKLSDIDLKVLERLIADSVAAIQSKYPSS